MSEKVEIQFDIEEDKQEQLYSSTEIKKFNWGAFAFTWLWAMFNGTFHHARFFVLVALCAIFSSRAENMHNVTMVLYGILLIMSFRFGLKGNAWALSGNRTWQSVKDFTTHQRKWAKAVFVYALVIIAGYYGYSQYTEYNYNTTDISPYGRGKLTAEAYVEKIVEISKQMPLQFGKDVVDVIMAEYEASPSRNSEISRRTQSMFKVKTKRYTTVLSFYKEPQCSLIKKNCFIYYYESSDDSTPLPYSRTYYDDEGNTKTIKIQQKNNN